MPVERPSGAREKRAFCQRHVISISPTSHLSTRASACPDTQEKKRIETRSERPRRLTEMDPPTQSLQDLYIPRRAAPVIPIVPPVLPIAIAIPFLNPDALGDNRNDLLHIKIQDPMINVRTRMSRRRRMKQRGVGLDVDYRRWEFVDGCEGVFVRALLVDNPLSRTDRE
jgi:hypothetical protein